MFFQSTQKNKNHSKTIYSITASLSSLFSRKEPAPTGPKYKRCRLSPSNNRKTQTFVTVDNPVYILRKDNCVLSPIRLRAEGSTLFFASLHRSFWGLCAQAKAIVRHLFSCRLCAASLTVEAALELPLFFVFAAIILQYASVMRTAAQYSGSLTTTAQEMAIAAYKQQYGDANNIIRAALSDAWAATQVIDTAEDKDAVRYASFLNSSYLKENDLIRLVLSYQPRPAFTLISPPLAFFVQKAAVRGWIGKDGYSGRTKEERGDNSQNKSVYVTEHGSVYHTNPDCSHLKVTVIPVSQGQLKSARNTSGSKYKKCPYCGNHPTGQYYVDPYGTCWHTSAGCSALKRTVHERDIEECGHMHECKDCRKARGG